MPFRRRVGPKVAVLHKAIFEEGVSIHFAHHVKVERIPCTGRSVWGLSLKYRQDMKQLLLLTAGSAE